jgi:phosphoglycolate phosphatase
MLAEIGLPPRSTLQVSTYVGKGIVRLVERCLTGDLHAKAEPELLKRAMSVFAPAYEAQSGRDSRIYPGVVEGLDEMADAGLRLACVTNKAARFTAPLLERMGLRSKFKVVVCGDEVARGKPDPLCYLRACELLNVQPSEATIIGDSENDVLAARAAGIHVLCVSYGYREGRSVESLGADAVVPDLLAAAKIIRNSLK